MKNNIYVNLFAYQIPQAFGDSLGKYIADFVHEGGSPPPALFYVHSSYLVITTQPAVMYFFQAGVLFSKENAYFWPVLAIFLRI